MLPKQSTELFRRTGDGKTITSLWGKTLVFPHTPLAPFCRFAVLRTEVSPSGDKGAALDLQGGRVPLDSLLVVAERINLVA